ncbi:pectate lyase, partial [Bacillus subtilis]
SVTINGGSARLAADKIFQINKASTFTVKNFTADQGGKFIRQLGGSTFKAVVNIDNCTITNMKEAIFRTDSSTSSVTMTNTRYSKVGQKWIGVKHATERN